MNFLNPHFQIAIQAAIDASFVVMKYYKEGFNASDKADGTPVTDADKASSDLIHLRLSETNIPVIGEEITNLSYSERVVWTKNWCVDPLDGTNEFISKNGEFAINIALIENQKPTFGIIVAPTSREIIYGGKETGVFLAQFDDQGKLFNTLEIQPNLTKNDSLRILTSRSYHSLETESFIQSLLKNNEKAQYVHKGSALKFFDLALGKADFYPRFGTTMEWDIAAGQAIIEALGGQVKDVTENKDLVYNKQDLKNPHFIAKSPSFVAYEA
jgi:3'(2'), 5'-bisphosphate nucleotidase